MTAFPFCDLRAAYAIDEDELEAALKRVLRSGRYVLGPEVDAFESEWARACATEHAVGVSSGTDALALALRAGGVGPGDEVIVPGFTATATWMAVSSIGARPMGADVDAVTGLLDPEAAAERCGPRTAAVVAVHLFGRLAPMRQLRELADRRGLMLVEDAAHAHGADEGDGPAGSLGDVAAFSFYPTKVLGSLGEAGAVVTGNSQLAESVRRLRSNGWSSWQEDAALTGANSRLDELQAAALRVRLGRLGQRRAQLRALAARYRAVLADSSELDLPALAPDGLEPSWHQFVVGHADRDGLRAALRAGGVGTAVHYDPIPPQLTVYSSAAACPRAVQKAARSLSLPLDAWLSEAQVEAVGAVVADSVTSVGRSRRKRSGRRAHAPDQAP